MTSPIDREEFRRRYIARMTAKAPSDGLDSGMSVADYAERTHAMYFDDAGKRETGPEYCADIDVSTWGEE